MAKVRMLTGMAGHDFSLSPGDPHECDDAEAERLIATDAAIPWVDDKTEKAVKRGPAETR